MKRCLIDGPSRRGSTMGDRPVETLIAAKTGPVALSNIGTAASSPASS